MDPAADDPTTLGRYRVLGRLGTGGMGRVLLGVDDTGRRSALTLVDPHVAAEPGFRDRFRRVVQAAASAPPSFTAPVLDADPDAEQPWVATAYVEGPSLQAYVEGTGPLGEQGTVALAVRMADGLVALHGAGLVHGDLNPATVLLAEDGPRLIDVGISRSADPTALARTGHVMGTPGFMSPEQVAGGREVGPPSDVFSFGSVIGFAATGRSPFAGDTPQATFERTTGAEPDLGPVQGRLRDAVLACLGKDPATRPTAPQLRDVLRALDGTDPAAIPTTAIPTTAIPTTAIPTTAIPTPAAHTPAAHTPAAHTTAIPTAAVPAGAPMSRGGPPTVVGAPVPVLPAPPPGRRPGPGRPRGVLAIAAAALAGVLITLAAVWFLSDRSTRSDADPAAAAPTSGAGPTTPSAATSTAPRPSGTADPAAGATVIDAETDPRFGADGARFATPSGNIACAMSTEQVRCDVRERTWQVPAAPADCQGDHGTGAVLEGTGAAELSCVSDTIADAGLEVLDYGEAVRFAGVVCVSRETGLRCENTGTEHGFTVARASYELF